MLCLDLFFCQNSVIVTEKSVTAWEQSFTKTISNYFCVISPYEFRICWKSCWKVDKFFTIEQERRSTDAWIFFNFFQPNTNDNSPSLRNCWVFFYLLFFVSLFLLHQSLTDLYRDHTSLMNELPVIGSLCLRKDFWDRHGTNIATRQKEIYGERLFRRPKKKMERDKRFFPEVLSQMINNDVDAWEVKLFIRITTKYVIKDTDKLLSLGKVYCEIVIA